MGRLQTQFRGGDGALEPVEPEDLLRPLDAANEAEVEGVNELELLPPNGHDASDRLPPTAARAGQSTFRKPGRRGREPAVRISGGPSRASPRLPASTRQRSTLASESAVRKQIGAPAPQATDLAKTSASAGRPASRGKA